MISFDLLINWLIACVRVNRRNIGEKAIPRKTWNSFWSEQIMWIGSKELRASEMAQRIKVLAPKPEDMSSIPGTHMMGRKNWLLQVVLQPLHTHPTSKKINNFFLIFEKKSSRLSESCWKHRWGSHDAARRVGEVKWQLAVRVLSYKTQTPGHSRTVPFDLGGAEHLSRCPPSSRIIISLLTLLIPVPPPPTGAADLNAAPSGCYVSWAICYFKWSGWWKFLFRS